MTIRINGQQLKAKKGDTILDAARRAGAFIPTLCHDDKLAPYSSCFICAVKVKGERRLTPACSTPVTDGMEITTDDDEIRETRRLCLELLLSDHCGDCLPPCLLACPAGCDARGYVNLLHEGRYDEARRLIMETIPMPATIGRICPHPCEDECRRAVLEEPISICALKRVIGDKAPASTLPRPQRSTGKRVAIVGAGPAGLTAAYFLALAGHGVTVFEAREKAGGMLRYGIPHYRLPKEILDREIDAIRSVGVALQFGAAVTLPTLRARGFDAVLVAVGAQLNRRMGIEGEGCEGVYEGIDFLADVASGKRPRVGRTVLVVGGGDTAIDAARTALRLGGGEVTIVYRRSRNEMPASAAEIEAAEDERITLKFLTLPTGIARTNGALGITCCRMALGEPDASGRRRPVPIPGSDYTVSCDSIIMAIGQSVDTSVLRGSGLEPTPRGRIGCREDTLAMDGEGTFAAGDCVTGPDVAVNAIASGRRAAHAIDSYLKTGVATPLPELFSPARRRKELIDTAEYASIKRMKRAPAGELDVTTRVRGFPEVEQVLDEERAHWEAYRCLDCGCERIKECTLRDLAERYGVGTNRFGSPEKRHPVDDRHAYVVRDPDKCIKCARCIRVCLEVQGIAAWCNIGRGFEMQVAPPFGAPLQDTDCESCGQCITACPTGALSEKQVLPKALTVFAEEADTTCAHCGVGCSVTVHTAGRRLAKITPRDNGNLCEKGKFKFEYLSDKRRIIFPMARRKKRLARVSWPEAREIFYGAVRGISGKRMAVFISSRSTDEEAHAAQRLARAVLKTNNIYSMPGGNPSRKLLDRLRPFASPQAVDDIEKSDAVVLVNPDTALLNEVAALSIIRAVRRGARLLIVGKRKTKLDKLAWKKSRVNPGHVAGYTEDLARCIRGARHPIIVYNRDCISDEAIVRLHRFTRENRAGIVSLTTEINAQGLLDAGVSPLLLPGQVPVGNRALRERLSKKWGAPVPARAGLSPDSMLRAMERGDIEAAVFLGAHRHVEKVIGRALGKVRFVAAQAVCPSPLTRRAELVIPSASWVETGGTFTRYDGTKLTLTQALPPLCGYSNLEIWQQLFEKAR